MLLDMDMCEISIFRRDTVPALNIAGINSVIGLARNRLDNIFISSVKAFSRSHSKKN